MQILFGLIGIASLLAIAFIFSENKKAINYRTVGGAFGIQVVFAVFVLYSDAGSRALNAAAVGVNNVIGIGKSGIEFVFGPLATFNIGFIFLINVLMLIVFFSSLISVLYYLKIMPLIINSLGWAVHKLLGTSKAESLSATANIFVGQTEAPLVVRPFLNYMTKSELFAIMVGGLASVAGSVLAGYAELGVELRYLIAASFMAAPGGLLMAKILVPQTEKPIESLEELQKLDSTVKADPKPVNVIEAAANGASAGMMLVINVTAMLIAFIGLTTLIDGILSGVGGWFNYSQLSLKLILGFLFSPIALAIGIPANEILTVGGLLGQKIVLNEFVAYIDFVGIKETLSAKSQVIITFALCGFANLSSIGILIGGLGVMAPNKKPIIAKYALKAILAGTLSNLMSATLAGMLIIA